MSVFSFAVAADSHFKAIEPLGRSLEGGSNSRTVKKLDSLKQFVSLSGVDFLVYLGDLFDSHNPPNWLRSNVAQIIAQCKVPFIYVPGNHDWSGQVGAFESEGFLSDKFNSQYEIGGEEGNLPGFYYIKSATEFIYKQVPMLFVPFYDHLAIKHEGQQVLFSHFYAEGASLAKSNQPLVLKGKGTPIERIKKFPLCFLGDIHKHQRLPIGKFGTHYPGCLSRINIDDGTLETGYLKVTLEADKGVLQKPREVRHIQVPDWDMLRLEITLTELDDVEQISIELPEKVPEILQCVFKGPRDLLSLLPIVRIRKQVMDAGVERFVFDRVFSDDPQRSSDEVTDLDTPIEGTLPLRWKVYCQSNLIGTSVSDLVAIHLED